MPKVRCNRCPIQEFCNTNPIFVDVPSKVHVEKTGRSHKASKDPKVRSLMTRQETIKKRLCPLLIAIGSAVRGNK